MIRAHSQKQLTLPKFDTPFETALDKTNRWVKMAEIRVTNFHESKAIFG
jgi:transposase, IS5 family